MAHEIVIAGGGFGGLYAARRLERELPRHSARITLVADQNFLLYTPLMPGAAAGSLEPRHVVVALREELDWADLRLARVTGAEPSENRLHLTTLTGAEETLAYDQLIVALGSVSRVLPIPGLAEYGLGFKSLADAIDLRNRVTTRVPGHDNVWAIGDAAAVPDPARPGQPSPPTAQHVIRQARVAGDNVAAALAGGRLRKFRYRTLGVFVDMGQHKAVATMLGVRLRGFPAWFAARTYHVLAMPGTARRLRIVADWTVGLLFGRASAQLGNLGHPTSLGEYSEEHPRGGERLGERQEAAE